MKTVSFTVKCYGIYRSHLDLPKEFMNEEGDVIASEDEVLTYVRTHLPEANVEDLEFLDDLEDICDAVGPEDIRCIY